MGPPAPEAQRVPPEDTLRPRSDHVAEARHKGRLRAQTVVRLSPVQDERKKRRLVDYWPFDQFRHDRHFRFGHAAKALDQSGRGLVVPTRRLRLLLGTFMWK